MGSPSVQEGLLVSGDADCLSAAFRILSATLSVLEHGSNSITGCALTAFVLTFFWTSSEFTLQSLPSNKLVLYGVASLEAALMPASPEKPNVLATAGV